MKKLFGSISLILSLSLILCSCANTSGNGPDVTEGETFTSVASPVEQTTLPQEEMSYEAMYGEELDEVYKIAYNGTNKNYSFLDEGYENLGGVCETARNLTELDSIGYVIEDISGDDIPELLICVSGEENEYNPGTRVLNVFSCKNGTVDCLVNGWYRNAWYLLGDGDLFNRGSSGAAMSINARYGFSSDSDFICRNMFFTSPDSENTETILFYKNENGIADSSNSASAEITEEDFNNFVNDCINDETVIEFTPISEWGISSVKAEFADESDTVSEGNEVAVLDDSEKAVKVVLSFGKGVKCLKFLALTPKDVGEDEGIAYDVEVKKQYNTVVDSVVVQLVFYGDLPNNGFSVMDKFGNEIFYSIELSGEDGSVQTSMFFN